MGPISTLPLSLIVTSFTSGIGFVSFSDLITTLYSIPEGTESPSVLISTGIEAVQYTFSSAYACVWNSRSVTKHGSSSNIPNCFILFFILYYSTSIFTCFFIYPTVQTRQLVHSFLLQRRLIFR